MRDPRTETRVSGASSHQIHEATSAPERLTLSQAVVLTLVPSVLTELAPPPSRFCRKSARNDCRAEVDELFVLPPRSPMSFSKAELRLASAPEDRLDDGSVLLISWLSERS
jgi:hypothetical protein